MWEILARIFSAFTGKATDKIAEKVGETVGERIADKLGPLAPSDLELPPDIKVVPKGLRSFDEGDAGFFVHLLPGPYREDGLPESIHFWKTRIEEMEADKTFRVGLIYGPSGCGKSSLVKAGLIPRLADHVTPVYLLATPSDTENSLLAALKRHCPYLSPKSSLRAALRRKDEIPEGRKVLLILDQFEQYLHATQRDAQKDLVDALRECDGAKLQCMVMVRDDFITPVTRFMKQLEIRLADDRNYAMVDLFDKRHAKRVLALFGRADGPLPKSGNPNLKQDAFLDRAISDLAEGDYVICVRLALFAQMVKAKEWTPTTLKAVGGAQGVGAAFLEDSFVAKTAPLENRRHEKAARKALNALLPEPGTDIKAAMKSRQELLDKSGYARRLGQFDELLEVLDTKLRLVTPTDAVVLESDDTAPTQAPEAAKYYQLTHDYLVPSLREWLTRKQKETWGGRAEIRLAERSSLWSDQQENRNLPAWWEHLDIRLFTRKRNWTEPQRRMMRAAGKYHGVWALVLCLVLAAIGWLGFEYNKGTELHSRLLSATESDLPLIVAELGPYRHRWLAARMERELRTELSPDAPSDEIKRLSQKHANVAAGLLKLRQTGTMCSLLEHRSDLTRRSHVIHRLGLSGADPQPLVSRLDLESDPSIRQGLILALGEFRQDAFSSGQRKQVIEKMLRDYRKDLDPGIHGATGWLLRQWGQGKELKEIDDRFSNGEIEQGNRRWYVSKLGLTMLLIPAGTFEMGSPDSDPEADSNERPRHPVTLSAFYLSEFEVTQGQYQRVMDNNPSSFSKAGDDADRVSEEDTSCFPVETVSWDKATEFCKRLSAEEGKTYRLPTEAEWEYACRAGTTTQWSCGDESTLRDYAWYGDNSELATHGVGDRMPNSWGLCDMHGNVDEWCEDWFGHYPAEHVTNPRGPSQATYRVLRGGCWDDVAGYCRAAFRRRGGPGNRNDYLGFRVAAVPPGESSQEQASKKQAPASKKAEPGA